MRGLYLRHETALITIAASIIYIAVGMHARFLLNWIIGPVWPIVCVWFVPPIVRRLLGWDEPLPYQRAST